MTPDTPAPADPNQGFPNPHAEHFEGERTPEEQYEYERQQAARDAIAGTAAPAEATPETEAPPANPMGSRGAAW